VIGDRSALDQVNATNIVLALTTDVSKVAHFGLVWTTMLLPASRGAALRDRCAAHDVTPSTAMFTAFTIVLARWAGHRRMLLTSLQLNRLPVHPDVHRVAGAFSSTMLLPAEPAQSATFAELAAQAQNPASASTPRTT
jgi:mycobactin phenyloxazoline synthetase